MKTPTLPSNHSSTITHDPIKRLSLAVRELDKLINRANQLASLSEQPFLNNPTGQPPSPAEANPRPRLLPLPQTHKGSGENCSQK